MADVKLIRSICPNNTSNIKSLAYLANVNKIASGHEDGKINI
jgi:hypothetical protein